MAKRMGCRHVFLSPCLEAGWAVRYKTDSIRILSRRSDGMKISLRGRRAFAQGDLVMRRLSLVIGLVGLVAVGAVGSIGCGDG